MTHPTPPKRYNIFWTGDAAVKEEITGNYMDADEALAYAEAAIKQARLDALEEAAKAIADLHSGRELAKDVFNCVSGCIQHIRKLKENK